jgi:hypothetical protein
LPKSLIVLIVSITIYWDRTKTINLFFICKED